MFSYEDGIFVAFLIWALNVVRVLVVANSRTQKNLAKIGKKMSLNLGVIVDISYKKEATIWKVIKFTLINILLPLPFILLSWVYVFFVVGSYVYVFVKDMGAPAAVKEFRWKMKNTDLSVDQMIKYLITLSDSNMDDFEKIKKDLLDDINYRKLNS